MIETQKCCANAVTIERSPKRGVPERWVGQWEALQEEEGVARGVRSMARGKEGGEMRGEAEIAVSEDLSVELL